jgi:sensor histidine kinase YesM
MKKIVVVSLHLGYWLLYLLLLLLILVCLHVGTNLKQTPFFANLRFEIFFTAFAVLPAVLGFYSFYTVLFDWLLIKRRIWALFGLGTLTALVCGSIGAGVVSLLHQFGIGPGVFNDGFVASLQFIIIIAIIAVLNGIIGLIVKGFIRWYNELKLKEELTQRNFEMEMALVKAQFSPHFLFNTLNNIDALISKNTSQASICLNQLSDIMRFMLYETKTERIALSRELAYLEQYISLQKIRTLNPDFVSLQVRGEVSSVEIAPMILIPFVENAFKHATPLREGEVICIDITAKPTELSFRCWNRHRATGHASEYGGLGNELIRKRLALLYPNRHQLTIENQASTYEVRLVLNDVR